MEYNSFITELDVKNKGYDLHAKGRLNQGDFNTIEEAIDDFLQTCFDTIYDKVEEHKGVEWTDKFFYDMAQFIDDEVYPNAYKMQLALRKAILIQTIFLYENGDASESSNKEERLAYAPKAIRLLYSNHII